MFALPLFAALFGLWLPELAHGADLTQQLTWNLSVKGQVVGTRTVTVKFVGADEGQQRILESWTEIHGQAGPVRLDWRQRLTAVAVGQDPAAFTSVIDEGGRAREIQGRYSPAQWTVTVNADGRLKQTDWPIGKIDLSTADLMDPDSRFPLAHFETARILSAESGDVVTGTVKSLGPSLIDVKGAQVQCTGYQWDSGQGRQTFWYSPEGFLVRYEITLVGIPMVAELAKPPPGGLDDFPVAAGHPKVEESAL
ncbi:MAG: hypothetical protein H0V89_11740 [Deltaproteobacteria bacterium]|nr:hypothetical protein [Deltaproteobacteria bacterium]